MIEQISDTRLTDPTVPNPIIAAQNEHLIHGDVQQVGEVAEAVDVSSGLQAEADPRPAHETLEASIQIAEVEAGAAVDVMDKAYEAGDDETKQRIDRLEEDYEAAIQTAESQGQEPPSFAEFLGAAKGIPEDYKKAMQAYGACIAKARAVVQELENHASEKAAEVRQKAVDLETSLDYDKVVAQAYADVDNTTPSEEDTRRSSAGLLRDISKVIGVRKLIESGAPLTYQQLKLAEYGLTAFVAECEEKGLFREQDETVVESGTIRTHEQIAQVEAHLQDVYDIHTKYKKFDLTSDEMVRSKTRAVLDLTHHMRQYSGEAPTDFDELYRGTKIFYNDGLGVTVNRRLTQKLRELPADAFETDTSSETYRRLIEQAKSIDVDEALKKLEVSGSFENLPVAFTEIELKQFLRISVPAAVLASVKRIQFRPITQEERKEDNMLGFHTWSDELGGPEIIISDEKIREHYQDRLKGFSSDPDADQYAQISARNAMLQIIIHEFGHELHNILPVAALKRWEDQRATDPTNITAYVKDRHSSGHNHRYMEDFADTMALFIMQPEVLTVISPTRFNAMRQIFEEVMPLYPGVTREAQDHAITTDRMRRLSRGIRDEDMRARYLRSEVGN